LTSNIAEGGVFLSTLGESVPDCQFEMAPVMYFDEGLSAPSDHAFCMATKSAAVLYFEARVDQIQARESC
jgi:hypothetical protein